MEPVAAAPADVAATASGASSASSRTSRYRHLAGITTNPTIFANAITGSDAYTGQLRDLARRWVDVGEAVRAITSWDVRAGCDALRPVYEATGHLDGRVSIQVDLWISHDTEATLAEARALWWLVDRPNLFIKIPATIEGLPAIADCLAEGISINVTLVISLARYQAVLLCPFVHTLGARMLKTDSSRRCREEQRKSSRPLSFVAPVAISCHIAGVAGRTPRRRLNRTVGACRKPSCWVGTLLGWTNGRRRDVMGITCGRPGAPSAVRPRPLRREATVAASRNGKDRLAESTKFTHNGRVNTVVDGAAAGACIQTRRSPPAHHPRRRILMQVEVTHKPLVRISAVIIGAALFGAACSSNGSKSTSSAPSSASSGGGSSAEVDAASKAIEPYLKVPEKINQSEPLKAKIPTNKPWVIITCELPQCQTISNGALDAAKTAGVPTMLLNYKTTDGTTLTSAMKQALDAKPFAVSPVGFSQAVWDNLQPQYKSAGVIITTIAVGDTKTSDVVTEGSASQFDYNADGGRMANFVIKDSKAAAQVLLMDVPAFAVLKAYGDGFKSSLSKGCSGCKLTPLDLAPAQLANNGVVPAVVSALQKDKSIKYLAATDGAFLVGINAALTAAGLTDIKILGGSPDINNLNALKQGTQTAWTAAAEDQYGWVALDAIGRKVNGQTIAPGNGGRVAMIATKDNVGTPSPTGLGAPKDYRDQYKKLWGLS